MMNSPEQLTLDPRLLKPNPWNSNRCSPEMELRLEESMRRNGCFKPILVRQLPDDSFQIIGGEHRAGTATRLNLDTVPVINLGHISEAKAKEIGLIDNGRYGEDDPLLLGVILRELGVEDVMSYLPYQPEDLAGLFAAAEVNFDDLDIDGDDDIAAAEVKSERPALTHAVLRFKVPIAEQEALQKYIQHVVGLQGLKDSDQMLAAGMALMAIVAAAKESL
jgi:ParB-like chromosome segregation protein Spo0J